MSDYEKSLITSIYKQYHLDAFMEVRERSACNVWFDNPLSTVAFGQLKVITIDANLQISVLGN